MTPETTQAANNPRPEVAAALHALIASPLGTLLAAMLPSGVLEEIGAVLERAISDEAKAREGAVEAERALIARAEADKARADAAEARLEASNDETARLRSRLGAAEAENGRLTDLLARVRALLGDIAGTVADTIATIDEPLGAYGSAPRAPKGSATDDSSVCVPSARGGQGSKLGSSTDAHSARAARGPRDAIARDAGRPSIGATNSRTGDTVPATGDPAASEQNRDRAG